MDDRIAQLARDHGGVLGRHEALAAGMSDWEYRRLRSSDLAVPSGRRSVRAVTTPDSFTARLWSVLHDVGGSAVVTGAAAATLLGVSRVREPDVVEVVVASTRRPRAVPGARLIHALPGDLIGSRVVTGIAVTSPEVTLRQLARHLPREPMVTVLQDELRRRTTTVGRLLAATGRGREGSAALRAALAVAGDGSHARAERRMAAAVRRLGVPLETQVNLRTRDGASYWLDGLVRAARLGYELEGPEHLDPVQHAYDCRRANRVLVEHRIDLMRFASAAVHRDPAAAATELAHAVQSRLLAS